MRRRNLPGTAAIALLVLGSACVPDRIAAPEPQAVSPEVERALWEVGPSDGPVMVLSVVSDEIQVTRAFRPTDETGLAVTSALDAGATDPGDPRSRADLSASELVFITNPAGPNTGGAANTVNVVTTFFCIVNGRRFQVRDVTVNSMALQAIAGSGGHLGRHDIGTKPKGNWKPSSGRTDGNGNFNNVYTSGIASGDEATTVRYTINDADSPCRGMTGQSEFHHAIRYLGMVPIEAREGIHFDAITSDHNSVFFAAPYIANATYAMARYYRNMPGVRGGMRVNAASLVFGGINDVNRNWRTPHSTHRIGTDVDVDGPADSQPVWDRLIEAGQRGGGFQRCEVHDRNHVHCFGKLPLN